MLTSRSEYRLLLRQDNADVRLTPVGRKYGLVDDEQYRIFTTKQEEIKKELERLKDVKIPANEHTNTILAKYQEHIEIGTRAFELLKHPNISYETIKELDNITKAKNLGFDVTEQVEILIKYDGYLKRQELQVKQAGKLDKFKIPDNIDYSTINHISSETKDKLSKIRPKTLAQASRIGGVKPADISILMVMLERHQYETK